MTEILLVEDDSVLAETLRYNLEREGYQALVAGDGAQGLDLARSRQPDLLVLDVMLPALDGFSLCRLIRRESGVPILMLTARDDEVDRIAGLELGADDYLIKPFSLGELLARIRVLLRRTSRRSDKERSELFSAGDLLLNAAARRVFRGQQELSLSQKEFDLLLHLMRNRGMALSRDLLLERVWGYDFVGDTRTVDVHIRWLREKIEAEPSQPELIQTVRGIGYRFREEEPRRAL